MKKISGVVLSLLLIVIFAFGCTYADSATLSTINTKYEHLVNNERYKDVIFKGKYLALTYDGKINSAITSSSSSLDEQTKEYARKFTLLKTATNVEDYLNCSHYGLLSYAVNTIYLSNYATLNSQANNEKVSQKTKTKMYNYLDKLESNTKELHKQKEFLEKIFADDSRDFQEIVKTSLAQDSLNTFLESLNSTLLTLLEFNNTAFEALEDIEPRNLENINSLGEFSNSDINSLTANAVLLVSNYILRYDLNLKDNLTKKDYDVTLINQLKQVLNLSKKNYSDNTDATKLANFKLICADENGMINNEKLFKQAINGLNKKDLENEEMSLSLKSKVNVIEEYKTNLTDYLDKLINFLNNI